MANPGHSGRQWREMRAAILAASDICYLCGERGADSVDYRVPYSLGGRMHPTNLKPAHLRCNQRKGTKPPHNPTSRDW